VTGTPNGGVGFDTEYKAFTFDGVDDYINGTLSNPAGEWLHSVSYWLKPDAATLDDGDNHYAFNIGPVSTTKMSGGGVSNKSPSSIFYASVLVASDYTFVQDAWTHLVIEYTGGYHTSSNVNFYINGEAYNGSFSTSGSSPGTTALNLNANTPLNLGYNGNGEWYSGSIANFRLFNRALSADEVWQLYAYQKDYFQVSPDVVTFKGGRLGIGTSEPRAVLDVQGDIHGGCPVYFQALYNANFSATAYNNGSGGALIPWNKLFEHKGSCFDTSTGLFTAPIDGVYRFGYSVRKQTASYSTCWTYIQKNGAPMNGINNSPGRVYVEGSASVFVSQTFILDLSAGDTIGILLAESDASGTDARISNSYNYFHGYYIGTGNGSFGSYSY
jgi:hypothetical protein